MLMSTPYKASVAAASHRRAPALGSSSCVHQGRGALALHHPRSSYHSQATAPGRRSVAVQALVLPPLVPLAARLITSGVLFYASMNWVLYRGARKDVSFSEN